MPTIDDRSLGTPLADLLARLDPDHAQALRSVLPALCSALEQGHTCLPLVGELAGLNKELAQSPAISQGESPSPLVLEHDRLYLRRYWQHERSIARRILTLATRNLSPADTGTAFPDTFTPEQAQAAEHLRDRGFTLVTGGPGTGKSTFAAAVAKAFIEAAAPNTPFVIQVAAPTGRAAARLGEALEWVTAKPPVTLHRLLGYSPSRGTFRHHEKRPLYADLLIVDECSMIDVVLFDALLSAINPATTRLLLLGDAGQLASVDAGSVFGEITQLAAKQPGAPFASSVFAFTRNWRFPENSALGRFTSAVRSGDASTALALAQGEHADLVWENFSGSEAQQHLRDRLPKEYRALASASDPGEALARSATFRAISPQRHGPIGTNALNSLAMRELFHATGETPCPGALVIATRNDYELEIFNGDGGVCWSGKEGLRYVLPGTRGEPLRTLPVERLPDMQPAFALTVHRAQGSEYERVLLVLPDHDHPLLTRELIYTAATRARSHLRILGPEPVLAAAIARATHRQSGLAHQLAVEQKR